MTDNDNPPEVKQELLSILDKLIAEGHWDESLFLQASGKKIRDLRDELEKTIQAADAARSAQEAHAAHIATGSAPNLFPGLPTAAGRLQSNADKQEVYVALYLADGSKIAKWDSALDLLLSRSSTRPIYQKEQDVRDTFAQNGNKPNDAYVAISINKNDILQHDEQILTDRYQHPLLMLRENALQKSNVARFEHVSGTYEVKNGHLVKKT